MHTTLDLSAYTSFQHLEDVGELEGQAEELRREISHLGEQVRREQVQREAAEFRAAAAERRAQEAERRAAKAKQHAKKMYHDNCHLCVRLSDWKAPPPCSCGRISYEIYCVCGKRLG